MSRVPSQYSPARQDAAYAAVVKRLGGEAAVVKLETRYFLALNEFYGNRSKARMAVGLTADDLRILRLSERFKAREAEIHEGFVEALNEQNLRVALDDERRDNGHLWRVLQKVDQRWKDDPKVHEHRHTLDVSARSVDDDILELLDE